MPGQGGDTRPQNVAWAFLPQIRRPSFVVKMKGFQSLNKENNKTNKNLYFISFLFLQQLFEMYHLYISHKERETQVD